MLTGHSEQHGRKSALRMKRGLRSGSILFIKAKELAVAKANNEKDKLTAEAFTLDPPQSLREKKERI